MRPATLLIATVAGALACGCGQQMIVKVERIKTVDGKDVPVARAAVNDRLLVACDALTRQAEAGLDLLDLMGRRRNRLETKSIRRGAP